MPWTKANVDSHIKGLSDHQKTVWVSVANSALKKCQSAGGSDCDASAIRQANAAAKKAKSAESLVAASDVVIEAGRMISTANAQTLKTALKTVTDAMKTIQSLVVDDEVEESADVCVDEEIDPVLKPATTPRYEMWASDEAAKILAQDDSYDSVRSLVQAALRRRAMTELAAKKLDSGYDDYEYGYGYYPWIRDMYDDTVVYSLEGVLYQCDYKVSDKDVTLGDSTPVKISYVPATTPSDNEEAKLVEVDVIGELIELKERAVADDGTVRLKLIDPGWGSSGYYSEKILERDGPKVFKKGLHMYINHPTAEEDLSRPERDLRDLAGVLEEDAKYDKNGPAGPGLYATAKAFDTYRSFIDDAAPHIGTSIRASGRAVEGEAEGRQGYIVDGLVEGYSVDYVTLPGRGGQVLPLLEAARTKINDRRDHTSTVTKTSNTHSEVRKVTEEEAKALRESAEANRLALETANTEIARMKEGMILRDARELVMSTLAGLDLPDMTRVRLAESCAKNPPVKEGALDKDALVESTKAAAIEEMKYIESVAATNGKVIGVGAAPQMSVEDADKALAEALSSMGWDEKSVKTMVDGRN